MDQHVKKLLNHVVPIFITGNNKRPELIGSGFFYTYKDLIYLVSASHVFLDIKYAKSPIYIGVNDRIIQLKKGPVFRTDKHTDEKDHIDLMAFAIVPDNEYYEYIKDKTVSFPTHIHDDQSVTGQLLIQGYPITKNKPASSNNSSTSMSKVTPFSKLVSLEQNFDLSLVKKNHDVHYAIKFNRNKTEPAPRGLSGGPLWLITDNYGTFPIAIFIEYHKNYDIGIATKIYKIHDLIESQIALELLGSK